MTTFTILLTLTHPDKRELSVPLDLSLDTEAVYVLLAASVVADAGIPVVDGWARNRADEDRLVPRDRSDVRRCSAHCPRSVQPRRRSGTPTSAPDCRSPLTARQDRSRSAGLLVGD